MRALLMLILAAVLTSVALAAESENVDRLHGNVPVLDEATPPPLTNPDNSDVKRQRNYAMQPPIVPHKIEGYQLDKSANRCMFCHARTRTQESQAPMISVTHFMDRDGNFLAELSPRRYFCLQCHVPQAPVNPLVDNRFVDVDTILQRSGAKPAPAKK